MKGFTLLEILIYSALCSFIMLCSMSLLSACIGSYNSIDRSLSAEEEGLFILQKIEFSINTSDPRTNPHYPVVMPTYVIQSPFITAAVVADATGTEFNSHFLVGSSSFDFTSYK